MMSALDRKWSSIYASSHNRRIIKSLESASVGLGWSMPDSNEHDRHRKGRLIRVKLACGRRTLASSGMSGTSRTESSRVRLQRERSARGLRARRLVREGPTASALSKGTRPPVENVIAGA
jgi:hypothetical protein